jgi:hypothetical protein
MFIKLKMAPNYSNTKIYLIYCNNNISDIYIGQTTNIKDRMGVHRRCCDNPANKSYSTRMYNFIRNNGGWKNWSYRIIEEVNCSTKSEAEKKEAYWIMYYNPSLNTNKKFKYII